MSGASGSITDKPNGTLADLAAWMDLASEGDGLIDLDRPVAERVVFSDDPATRAITPRHLLSHSSGPNWRDTAGEPRRSWSKRASRGRPAWGAAPMAGNVDPNRSSPGLMIAAGPR